ncbi:unnamed protein product [Caenorhabditis bovis]|uniref:Uncharacterized protein n=1 Tax=Caenorhabditis bovis TaxID=2654633 RepID=A0A8S1ELJ2_9PELO|nr:unnamed protein product [Caenorhabditis bovis]
MRSSAVARSVAAARVQRDSSFTKGKIANGLTVVSQDNNGPVSQLVLAFRAGSRYQSPEQGGLVHHVRNFVGRDVQSYPGLQLVWSAAASGASMKAFSTRDVFGVHLTVPRDKAAYALSILGHTAAKPAFKPWEMEDVIPTLYADIAHKNPYSVVFEDIHRAAYRNGALANSVYATKGQVGSSKSKDLCKFAEKHFVSGNGVIVGYNVDAATLKLYADESGAIENGSSVAVKESPYRGGNFRRHANGKDAHIIIAGQGASSNDVKSLAAQAVLQAVIGKTSPLKFSSLPGTNSLLGKLPSGTVGSAFQAIHDQSGLVGVYILTNGSNAESSVKNTVASLRSAKVQDLEAAKRCAINDILTRSERGSTNALEEAIAALSGGPSTAELISAIGKVSTSDVESLAKKAFSKLSIASYGNISNVPYVDEL